MYPQNSSFLCVWGGISAAEAVMVRNAQKSDLDEALSKITVGDQ